MLLLLFDVLLLQVIYDYVFFFIANVQFVLNLLTGVDKRVLLGIHLDCVDK